jgi:hypothetical protein
MPNNRLRFANPAENTPNTSPDRPAVHRVLGRTAHWVIHDELAVEPEPATTQTDDNVPREVAIPREVAMTALAIHEQYSEWVARQERRHIPGGSFFQHLHRVRNGVGSTETRGKVLELAAKIETTCATCPSLVERIRDTGLFAWDFQFLPALLETLHATFLATHRRVLAGVTIADILHCLQEMAPEEEGEE